jgi:anti-sigma B factor antagonist
MKSFHGIKEGFTINFKVTSREIGDVTVLDLDGRITFGEGGAALRDAIREKLSNGKSKILINLAGTNYMDTSGLGELVRGYRAVKGQGGELKLLNLSKKVTELLQITKLYTIFDIHTDESQAVASFKT